VKPEALSRDVVDLLPCVPAVGEDDGAEPPEEPQAKLDAREKQLVPRPDRLLPIASDAVRPAEAKELVVGERPHVGKRADRADL